jgi:hypothetical protein
VEAGAVNQTRILGGDSETRHPERPEGATWASRRQVLASWREPFAQSIGHFGQVDSAAPLTRRRESSKSRYLAPQTGFGHATFRLTSEVQRGLPSEYWRISFISEQLPWRAITMLCTPSWASSREVPKSDHA